MSKIENLKKLKVNIEDIENDQNISTGRKTNNDKQESDFSVESKITSTKKSSSKKYESSVIEPSTISEVFYLEKEVRQIMKENENKIQNEITKINQECEKIEAKDRKYMETLKAEFLAKYQEEQDRCQKKLDLKKKKDLQRINKQRDENKAKIERMCEKEVLSVINKMARGTSWFEVSIKLYKSCPDFFKK